MSHADLANGRTEAEVREQTAAMMDKRKATGVPYFFIGLPSAITGPNDDVALLPLGLAVHNLASLPHISIAGAIATATHGSGDANQGLAGAVVGLELVTGTGEVLELRRGQDGPVPFEAAVVHLGALGIVTHVTLTVEPAFEVRQDVFQDLPWASLEQHFDAITGAAYSVSVFTRWNEGGADQVWLKSRVDALGESGELAYQDDFFGARPATTALVLFMTIPGLALFYGGMVRSKNILSVMMQCFGIAGLVGVLWVKIGRAHV